MCAVWQTIGLFVCVLYFVVGFRARGGQFLIDSWDSERGLPDNFVTSVVQTPEGYLWIGTYNGLARFDGARFVIFKPRDTPELGSERVVKLFMDAQGTLWINTYDGSLTSWRNGVFTKEWSGANKGISEAWMVASNSKEIIFAFRSGLLIRRPATGGTLNDWHLLRPPGNPRGATYCQDYTGTLWCSTLDGNVWRVSNDNFDLLPKNLGLRGSVNHWLAPDPYGHIWLGTDKELAAWDGERWVNRSPAGETDLDVASFSFTKDGAILIAANGRLRKSLNGKWIAEINAWPDLMQEEQFHNSFYEDRDGGIWRVSRGMGIFYVTQDGASQEISIADGLPGDHTTCWLEDQEGNFWVGLGNGGLARLRKKHFETLALPGPARPAVSVCEDQNGALWIGTYGGGLDRWQKGAALNYQIPAQSWGGYVFSVYPGDPGQLWISAGMEDLSNFQDEHLKAPPVAVHAVKSILVDREGRVWLGRKDGMDCWANGKLREWTGLSGPAGTPVRALAQDKRGVVWIGSDDGSLYSFQNASLRLFRLPAYPARQGIWSLLADSDGSLWIGTSDAGLLHFEDGRFTRFTSKNGLPDDLICQILEDHQGNLWLGSHHGICRVSKAALGAFASGKTPSISCSTYGRPDGLPSSQCSDMYQPSAWSGTDGRLWFATAKGVVGVQPDEVPLNSRPPPVIIEELFVGGTLQQLPQAGGAHGPTLKISEGEQDFQFHYTALSLTDPDKVQFRYKLEGYDSDWINSNGRRWTEYTYLKPGRYRFQVMACNNDGVWNESGASLNLQVLPHFWETWWFRILLSVATLASVAGVARYVSLSGLRRQLQRLEHQRDIERDRTRIARDIHDHIGSGLTQINLLNELLLSDPASILPDRVSQITGVTCELMSAMDEIVWAVNPKNDTLESLMSYLCDFTSEYLRAANIRLRISIPNPLPAWNLSSEVRHNIFLGVKEILNNIVKHSHASEVFFTVHLDAGAATLEIYDTGRGFVMDVIPLHSEADIPHARGNGLENLRTRASSIGGRCLIRSEPGKGTKVKLTIPESRQMLSRGSWTKIS